MAKGEGERERGAKARASRARTRVEARRKAEATAANERGRSRPDARGKKEPEKKGCVPSVAAGGGTAGYRTRHAGSRAAAGGRRDPDATWPRRPGGAGASRREERRRMTAAAGEEARGKRGEAAGLREGSQPGEPPAGKRDKGRTRRGATVAVEGLREDRAPGKRKRAVAEDLRPGGAGASRREERRRMMAAAGREARGKRGEAAGLREDRAEGQDRRRGAGRPRRLVLLSLLLLASLAAMLYTYTFTGVLNVRHVEIKGNEKLEASHVRGLSGIDGNTHLLKMNVGAVKEALLTDPYIASVKISRRFPDTVVVTVEERKPNAVILQNGKHYLVDAEGVVLEGREERPQGLAVMKGLDAATLLLPGDRITGERFMSLMALLQSLPSEIAIVTDAAGHDDMDGLYLESRGARIIYGDGSELVRKNLVVLLALQELMDRYRAVEYIDVSNPDHPVIKPVA